MEDAQLDILAYELIAERMAGIGLGKAEVDAVWEVIKARPAQLAEARDYARRIVAFVDYARR